MIASRNVSLILLLTLFSACAAPEDGWQRFSSNDARLVYTGRWNTDAPHAPWAGWQGSSVSVQFLGKEVRVLIEVDGETGLRLIVDGMPAEPVHKVGAGRHMVLLASGMDPGVPHTATLMKETHSSRLTLLGVEIADGLLLDAPSGPTRRIAFFGDSNMEGYSLYSEKDNGAIGTYYAYPATVARMLDATMQLQAVGSATLDGPTANDVVSFVTSETYEAAIIDYRDDFDPQVIVVNAGANDIFRVEPPEREAHAKQNYRNVITAIRDMYGDQPHIVLMNAYGWDVDEPANYSHEVVAEVGGKLSTHLFPWCWEQWHGDMVDHAGQAVSLARHIEGLDLGFSITRDAEVVSGYSGTFDVANGGFEGAARDGYGAFGWRYFEDGVERIKDGENAAEGDFFIRLGVGELVHQCVDATGDLEPGPTAAGQQYRLSASIRSPSADGMATLGADYEGQQMYQRTNPESESFAASSKWREVSTLLTAPEGTWKVFVVLGSESGTVDIDNVRLEGL